MRVALLAGLYNFYWGRVGERSARFGEWLILLLRVNAGVQLLLPVQFWKPIKIRLNSNLCKSGALFVAATT